jgi:hypothetical protein
MIAENCMIGADCVITGKKRGKAGEADGHHGITATGRGDPSS